MTRRPFRPFRLASPAPNIAGFVGGLRRLAPRLAPALLAVSALACGSPSDDPAPPVRDVETLDEGPSSGAGEDLGGATFSAEWAFANGTDIDWLTCGVTGSPVSDARVSVRGGRLQTLNDDPAGVNFLATVVVRVEGALALHNLPLASGGNGACAVKLPLPKKTFGPFPVPGYPLTVKAEFDPIVLFEVGAEDVFNGSATVPFAYSAEVGVRTSHVPGTPLLPYSRVLDSRVDPVQGDVQGAFRGYVEGNIGAGISLEFNEVFAIALNAYYEPNLAVDLPLSGCDMNFSLTGRFVTELCTGVNSPPGFPEWEAAFCPQLKGPEHAIIPPTDISILRMQGDAFTVAPGGSVALDVLANDQCLGAGVIDRVEGCPFGTCELSGDRRRVQFNAVGADGGPRPPGLEQASYCVRSAVDNIERCQDFAVSISCPPETRWVAEQRACAPCSSPAECGCLAPREWDGVACVCPPEAPEYDVAADACAPCAVEGSTLDVEGRCECAAPRQSDGFRCRCPTETPFFDAAANTCAPCPANQVFAGGECVCVEPAVLQGGACVAPCQPPSYWDGYTCRCPPGVPLGQCYPELACPLNSRLVDGVCLCDEGADCIPPPAPPGAPSTPDPWAGIVCPTGSIRNPTGATACVCDRDRGYAFLPETGACGQRCVVHEYGPEPNAPTPERYYVNACGTSGSWEAAGGASRSYIDGEPSNYWCGGFSCLGVSTRAPGAIRVLDQAGWEAYKSSSPLTSATAAFCNNCDW